MHKFMIERYQKPTTVNSCGLDDSGWKCTSWGSDDLGKTLDTAREMHEKGEVVRIVVSVLQFGEETHDLY